MSVSLHHCGDEVGYSHCGLSPRLHFNLVVFLDGWGYPQLLSSPFRPGIGQGEDWLPMKLSWGISPSLIGYLNPPQTFINRFSVHVICFLPQP